MSDAYSNLFFFYFMNFELPNTNTGYNNIKASPSQLVANREIMMPVKAIMAFRGVTETGDWKPSEVTVMASISQLQKHLYGFILNQHGYVTSNTLAWFTHV
jgi:hypothetical protein